MKKYALAVLFLLSALFYGCKSVPEAPQEAPPPEATTLTQDEIDVIDAVIDHIISYELRNLNIKDNMQVCINNVFFVHRLGSADLYEKELKDSEQHLKDKNVIDDAVIASFIKRNINKRTIEKDAAFASDFFWNGGKPSKPYFRAIFSNIGFDVNSAESNNTKALIHVSVDLPGFMFAEYAYLEKIDGKWTFNKCFLSWIT